MVYSLVVDVDSDTLTVFSAPHGNFTTAKHIIAVWTKYTVGQYINADLGIPHYMIIIPTTGH